MAWAKVKIFYSHVLAKLAATTTAAGFAIANILDWMEGSWWLADNTTTPMYITIGSGPGGGDPLTADYLFISGHNFFTIGARVTLQKSSTGAWAGEEVDVTTETPSNDLTFAKLFTSTTEDYWRLKITGSLSAEPQIAICVWGELVELDLVTLSFDPDGENEFVNTKKTQGGVISGQHVKYRERDISLGFSESEDALYQKVKALKEDHGFQNFGLGWETTEHPAEVYLVRREKGFKNPLVKGGSFRNVTLRVKGRRE